MELQRRLTTILLLLAGLLAGPAPAADVVRVTGPAPVADDVARLLAERLPGVEVARGDGPATLRVTVGARDFQAAIAGDAPVVGVALTRRSYLQLTGGRDGARTAVFWEPDPVRQLRLARALLPAARRASLLLGEDDPALVARLQAEARRLKLGLVVGTLSPGRTVAGALDPLLADSDFLLGVEDPAVISPATAKTLLLSSFRRGRPVIGPSGPYVDAGSLGSLAVSLPDVVDTLAAWLPDLLRAHGDLPPPRYPDRYSILTNAYVARSLRLPLPAAAELDAAVRAPGDEP